MVLKTCCPDTYCLRLSSWSGASNVSELGVSERTYRLYCLLRIAIEPSAGLQHVWSDQHQHCMPSLKSHAWLPKMSDPRPSLHLPVRQINNCQHFADSHFCKRLATVVLAQISSCKLTTLSTPNSPSSLLFALKLQSTSEAVTSVSPARSRSAASWHLHRTVPSSIHDMPMTTFSWGSWRWEDEW